MSDLLNQASLVMIPSGYKEDTVFSQLPQDGSGDLSFTRASNGTRINSAGLVEVCPWNLLEQSEAFSNTAVWNVLNGASVTANTTTAPNGTTTADTLTFSTNVSSNVYSFCSAPVGANVVSVYAKVASGTKQFRLRVDLPGGTTSSNFTATTEWQRFEFAVTTTTANLVFYIINDSVGVAGDLYVWGAQLNIGSTAKPYFPTTDRLNVPRLTYQNGGGGCPSLLLEKQSTNLFTYSEQFNDASWVKFNSSVSANTTTSPDGTQNADSLIENTSNTDHGFYKFAPTITTASGAVTISCFIKSNGRRVQIKNSYTTDASNFDLQNGVVVSNVGSGVGEIQNIGDGWYRCILKTTANASGNAGLTLSLLDNSNNMVYTGNGTSGVYIWGAQIEVSSYPTSYIPTTSSSATRVADACFKTGISSLIGQTEGTVFVEAEYDREGASVNARKLISANDGSSTNLIDIYVPSGANTLQARIRAGAVTFGGISTSSVPLGKVKIAYAYKANDFVLYINGSQIGTVTTGGSFTFSSAVGILQIGDGEAGADELTGKIAQAVIFKTRLTNAELQALTTL